MVYLDWLGYLARLDNGEVDTTIYPVAIDHHIYEEQAPPPGEDEVDWDGH